MSGELSMSGGSLFNGRHKESAAEEKMHYSGCERSKDLDWSKVGANQQEALQNLQEEYSTLWQQYEQLHIKSRQIIATLQEERDQKIAECETLRSQVQTMQQFEGQGQHKGFESVHQHGIEGNTSELETVRGEYKKLVCSYTRLKLDYESALARHQCELEDLRKEQDIEVSLLMEKLKLVQHENDTVFNIQQIRRLQKLNSEFEKRIQSVSQELEKVQCEHRTEMSKRDQMIFERSERLRDAQSQIKTLEVKCSSLSEILETTQDELAQCLEKQLNLQAAVEEAHRESSRIKEGFEENKAKHKDKRSSVEIKLTQEYQRLKESHDCMLSEKKAYEAQVELLQATIKDYEALIASKEVELDDQLQSLRQSEWEKRVAVERETTVLQEKLTAQERIGRISEEESTVQQTSLLNHLKELSTKCMALEAEVASCKAEQQSQTECNRKTEMELQVARDYKRKNQTLQSQYKRLLESKQQLESESTQLQPAVSALELAVSEAQKEVTHVTKVHQQTLHIERQKWQGEKQALLHHLNEEEEHVKRLLSAIEHEKEHSKKMQRHYKKKMLSLKDNVELAQAKQVKLEVEKESVRKSLGLEKVRLKKEISKLKQRENEFTVLLRGDYCGSGGLIPGSSMPQEHGVRGKEVTSLTPS